MGLTNILGRKSKKEKLDDLSSAIVKGIEKMSAKDFARFLDWVEYYQLKEAYYKTKDEKVREYLIIVHDNIEYIMDIPSKVGGIIKKFNMVKEIYQKTLEIIDYLGIRDIIRPREAEDIFEMEQTIIDTYTLLRDTIVGRVPWFLEVIGDKKRVREYQETIENVRKRLKQKDIILI